MDISLAENPGGLLTGAAQAVFLATVLDWSSGSAVLFYTHNNMTQDMVCVKHCNKNWFRYRETQRKRERDDDIDGVVAGKRELQLQLYDHTFFGFSTLRSLLVVS